MDYEAAHRFHTERCLPYFTFRTKTDKVVKIILRHLPGNISSEDINIALQELDSDFVRRQTSRSGRRGLTHTLLTLFLFTLARNPKVQEILKLTSLSNIVRKVEVYRSQE
jgi:hypothetical protein